jgi:hypothetical protein
MTMSKGWCDGGKYECGHPAAFVARCEDVMSPGTWEYDGGIEPRKLSTSFEACGKHLAALINAFPIPTGTSTRFIVVPVNPNVSGISEF